MSDLIRTKFAASRTAPGRIIQRLSLEPHSSKEPVDEHLILADIRRLSNRSQRRISRLPDLLSRAGVLPDATAAAMAILFRWDEFSEEARRLIAASIPGPLSDALQLVSAGSRDQLPDGAAADVLRRLPVPRQLPLLEAWIQSDREELRIAATTTLRDEGLRERRLGGKPASFVALVERLLLDGPDLPHRDVLFGTLSWLPQFKVKDSAVLSDTEHPTHMLLRGLLRSRAEELSGRELFELLTVDTVAPAARDAIAKTLSKNGLAQLAVSSHLLLAPGRRSAVQGLLRDRVRRRMPSSSDIELGTTVDDARLLSLTGVLSDSKANLELAPFIASTDPHIRTSFLIGVRGSAALPHQVVEALRDLSFDAHPGIARRAMLLLESSLGPRAEAMSRLHERSPHAICRELARASDSMGLSDEPLPAVSEGNAAIRMRRRLAENHDQCVEQLRSAITEGDTANRIAAMRWAKRLDVADACELELLAALASDDPRMSATAAITLASVNSDSAIQALMSTLRHKNDRTRANAIDAIARLRKTSLLDVERHTSGSPRERANVARACLNVTDDSSLIQRGGEILDAMLQDTRQSHRISGLWVAERLGRTESAQLVARLASHDETSQVRSRARRAAHRILAELESAVTVRATANAAMSSSDVLR